MALDADKQAEIDSLRASSAPTRRATVAGAGEPPLRAAPGARPRLHPRHRLHGRRRGDRAGGARVLWARHQAGQQRPRPDQLPDAQPAHEPVRDVRAQAAREAADLRRPAVDPAPHRQRERVFGPLLRARSRVLHPRPGSAEAGQEPAQDRAGAGAAVRPAGPAPSTRPPSRPPTSRAATRCWTPTSPPACCARSAASAAAASPSTRSCWATRSGRASPASSPAWCCRSTPTRSGTGRSICTTCCTSCGCATTRTRSTRSAPMPRCCSTSSRDWVPLTAAAFEEYRVDGAQLSAAALAVIRRRLAGETVTREGSGLAAGEWRELDGAAARTGCRLIAVRSGAAFGSCRAQLDQHDEARPAPARSRNRRPWRSRRRPRPRPPGPAGQSTPSPSAPSPSFAFMPTLPDRVPDVIH